jgi:glyoxylase-like metal-dependent hydrolase (beta-lactamase superfamily II)
MQGSENSNPNGGPDAPLTIEIFTLGPWATNCYLVHTGEGGEAWIIDASFGPAPIARRVEELGLTVRAIILTHAHVDHIAGLTELRTKFPKAEVLLHEAEQDWLENPMLNLSEAAGQPVTSSPADRAPTDGETLELGGHLFKVLHTPGHSPGGIALYCAESRVALVGDTLFAGSIGRSDFPTSDPDALFDSILKKLYTLPDETHVLPGHGAPTTIGEEKRSNPFVRAGGALA